MSPSRLRVRAYAVCSGVVSRSAAARRTAGEQPCRPCQIWVGCLQFSSASRRTKSAWRKWAAARWKTGIERNHAASRMSHLRNHVAQRPIKDQYSRRPNEWAPNRPTIAYVRNAEIGLTLGQSGNRMNGRNCSMSSSLAARPRRTIQISDSDPPRMSRCSYIVGARFVK